MGALAMIKEHMGSSIGDFLKEEGIFEEAQAQAVEEVVAWQRGEVAAITEGTRRKRQKQVPGAKAQLISQP